MNKVALSRSFPPSTFLSLTHTQRKLSNNSQQKNLRADDRGWLARSVFSSRFTSDSCWERRIQQTTEKAIIARLLREIKKKGDSKNEAERARILGSHITDMAEESIDSPVTPEEKELDEKKDAAKGSGFPYNDLSAHARARSSSVGSYSAGGSPRKNSPEKSFSVRNSQKVVPRYLSASSGSCHDFCKYGRKHSFEEKPWKPLRRKHVNPLADVLKPGQDLVLVGLEKEKVVHNKQSEVARNHSLPNLKLSPGTRSSSQKLKTSLDKEKGVRDSRLTCNKKQSLGLPSPDIRSYTRKPKASSDSEAHSPNRNGSFGIKARLSKYRPSSMEKFSSPEPPEVIKSVCFPSEAVEAPVQQCSSTANSMSKDKNVDAHLSKEWSSQVKSNASINRPSYSSNNSDSIHGKERRARHAERGRYSPATKLSATKALSSPAAALLPKLSPVKTASKTSATRGSVPFSAALSRTPSLGKLTSFKIRKAGQLKSASSKDQNRVRRAKGETANYEKVSKKTLHAIRVETKKSVFEPIPNENANSILPPSSSTKLLPHSKSSALLSHALNDKEVELSGYEAEGFMSGKKDSLKVKVPPKNEKQSKSQRSRMTVSEDAIHRSPVKLKFRCGTVVDLNSGNNSPRRLKFRRARAHWAEGGRSDLRRRTFVNAGVTDAASNAHLSSVKVILKHQDVQEKKVAQGLFNNVIEETATKLAVSRKSKVKALVGAFETVISLQESKPSSQAVI